jgi:hypothetical protein
MGGSRRRIKHTKSFKERLIEEATKFRVAAEQLPPGMERELLMKRVRQAEQAAEISDWLTAPAVPGKLSPACAKPSYRLVPEGRQREASRRIP